MECKLELDHFSVVNSSGHHQMWVTLNYGGRFPETESHMCPLTFPFLVWSLMTSCSEMGKTLRERERERVVYAIYAENRGSNNTKGDKHTIVG